MKVCRVIKLFTDTISSEHLDFSFQILMKLKRQISFRYLMEPRHSIYQLIILSIYHLLVKSIADYIIKNMNLMAMESTKFLIVNYRKKLVIDLVVYGQLMILIITFSFLTKA